MYELENKLKENNKNNNENNKSKLSKVGFYIGASFIVLGELMGIAAEARHPAYVYPSQATGIIQNHHAGSPILHRPGVQPYNYGVYGGQGNQVLFEQFFVERDGRFINISTSGDPNYLHGSNHTNIAAGDGRVSVNLELSGQMNEYEMRKTVHSWLKLNGGTEYWQRVEDVKNNSFYWTSYDPGKPLTDRMRNDYYGLPQTPPFSKQMASIADMVVKMIDGTYVGIVCIGDKSGTKVLESLEELFNNNFESNDFFHEKVRVIRKGNRQEVRGAISDILYDELQLIKGDGVRTDPRNDNEYFKVYRYDPVKVKMRKVRKLKLKKKRDIKKVKVTIEDICADIYDFVKQEYGDSHLTQEEITNYVKLKNRKIKKGKPMQIPINRATMCSPIEQKSEAAKQVEEVLGAIKESYEAEVGTETNDGKQGNTNTAKTPQKDTQKEDSKSEEKRKPLEKSENADKEKNNDVAGAASIIVGGAGVAVKGGKKLIKEAAKIFARSRTP